MLYIFTYIYIYVNTLTRKKRIFKLNTLVHTILLLTQSPQPISMIITFFLSILIDPAI